MSWIGYALLSALFAALTTILAKIGIKNIDSNLATAIRTLVIVVFAWGLVFWQGTARQINHLASLDIVFLILSGLATGLSWLFYFKALQLGEAAQVSPIDKLSLIITIVLASVFLKERVTPQVFYGGLLMTIGSIMIALAK